MNKELTLYLPSSIVEGDGNKECRIVAYPTPNETVVIGLNTAESRAYESDSDTVIVVDP